MASESDWHHDKQYQLRQRVQTNEQLHKRQYSKPLDVCDLIKKVRTWSCYWQYFIAMATTNDVTSLFLILLFPFASFFLSFKVQSDHNNN